MPDTARTLTQMLALLPLNNSGAINPQDVRDLTVTLAVKYGELYIDTPAATTIADTVNYFDVAGTYTAGQLKDFDQNVNGKLRYIGAPNIEVLIFANLSFTVAGTNDLIHLEARKNGVDIPGSDAVRKVGTGSDVGAMSIVGITPMDTNDELTLAVRNESATDDVTGVEGHLLALGVAI